MTHANNSEIQLGAIVEDSEDPDPNPAVVVRLPDATIDEWNIPDTEKTVADVNPDYQKDDSVVCIVFKSKLSNVPGWNISTAESIWNLVQKYDAQHYAYPAERLKQIGTEYEPRTTENGNRVIYRFRVTGVGDRLVYGTDFDGVDHQFGATRDVCFNKNKWDVSEENLLQVEYESERNIGEKYPPLLAGVVDVKIIEDVASPDLLLDL